MAIELVAFVVPDPLGKGREYFCPPPTPHMTRLGIGFSYHKYGVAPWISFVHSPNFGTRHFPPLDQMPN